ncbi:MAG: polyphosphate kinase 1 [Peptococcaceae bacterium]|nr:polyphosphate kinase 1 [Peptococcaceae bacterium]
MDRVVHEYTQNRELSWLSFNRRVLEEAQDSTVPLLERMKFVAIFTSNLDEFFMIRVGSLYDMAALGGKEIDYKSGMTPSQQMEKIYELMPSLYKMRDKIYAELKKELSPYGFVGLSWEDLTSMEQKYLRAYFKERLLPILSPQIVDGNHPFPHLQNKAVYVVANLHYKEKSMVGIVPVPTFAPEAIFLPGSDFRYIRTEKIIMEYLSSVFDQYLVSDKNYICVTRNADISPDDENLDINEDFRFRMKKLLHMRRRMAVVRLETALPLETRLRNFLCGKFNITEKQIFQSTAPMKLAHVYSLIDRVPPALGQTLLYPPFIPQHSREVGPGSIIRQVRRKDIILSFPYESMEPFLQLIKEASTDPAVMTIKITIYRLANKTRLVEYLCAAAENGKEVTVLIELRARFDEQRNIDWSERLEEAGCRVIYGFEDYKVHSKICLITVQNKGEVQYITQIGTGNYNEKTAALYTDLSLITADQSIGADASTFFKNMGIGNLGGHYEHLLVSPNALKQRLLLLIEEEIAKGSNGRITFKVNAITDYDILEKLAIASQAGVRIRLIVRSICCLLPGLPEITENVTAFSIVGRFLEHSRIYSFGSGNNQRLFIGSADLMTRNTERRVEIACPVYDREIKGRINSMLETLLKDNVKASVITTEGGFLRKKPAEGQESFCAQEYFMEEAVRQAAREPKRQKTGLVQGLQKVLIRFGKK